jgi:hypothetical protein
MCAGAGDGGIQLNMAAPGRLLDTTDLSRYFSTMGNSSRPAIRWPSFLVALSNTQTLTTM